MPKIDKIASFEITPERFLDACSPDELKELDLLLYSPRYQAKMKQISSISLDKSEQAKDFPEIPVDEPHTHW